VQKESARLVLALKRFSMLCLVSLPILFEFVAEKYYIMVSMTRILLGCRFLRTVNRR
jgi:hypothetical protein